MTFCVFSGILPGCFEVKCCLKASADLKFLRQRTLLLLIINYLLFLLIYFKMQILVIRKEKEKRKKRIKPVS